MPRWAPLRALLGIMARRDNESAGFQYCRGGHFECR
jgi:hypothetical protein